jgi:NAD-dependent deacetylase
LVWRVPELEQAVSITETADYFAVIGTSLQVYPAAGLIDFTNAKTPIYYIDPMPIKIPNLRNPLEVIPEIASEGMKQLKKSTYQSYLKV